MSYAASSARQRVAPRAVVTTATAWRGVPGLSAIRNTGAAHLILLRLPPQPSRASRATHARSEHLMVPSSAVAFALL